MTHLKLAAVLPLLIACAPQAGGAAPNPPDILLLCIDDLRPELNCYGCSYVKSPHIDALASRGRLFRNHYVQSPTCGASRYTLLTGRYGPANNNALFNRAKDLRSGQKVPPSLPAWFRRNGYTTVSVGKVSHHPGGRGGKDWNSETELEMPESWDRHLMPSGAWQHPRGAMHGLANGEIRVKSGDMDVFQSVAGADAIYPDGLITDETLRQIELLTGEAKPFFLAAGIIRPHLPFGAPAQYLEPYLKIELPPIPHPLKPEWRTTWHGSGEYKQYNRWGRDPNTDREFADQIRRHYAACVTYADAQVGRILDALKKSGRADNTIVVLWGDHGWNLGEHAIWGKHNLFEEALRSPLIIAAPSVAKPGAATDAIVETIDIFPTLCALAALPQPEFAQGRSLLPLLNDPAAAGRPAFSYWGSAKSVRTATHRLILHKDGYAELYDHTSEEKETKNIAAESPEMVQELTAKIQARL